MENQPRYRIELAETDAQIMDCHPVLQELRPHLLDDSHGFLHQFRELQRTDRYQLASLTTTGLDGHDDKEAAVVAVAGFCIQHNLAFGRHLLLQDLVTASQHRSQGYGRALLDWIKRYASHHECTKVMLWSGLQRTRAHQFYQQQDLPKVAYCFVGSVVIENDDNASSTGHSHAS